jgi:toxin ParE1/3/4
VNHRIKYFLSCERSIREANYYPHRSYQEFDSAIAYYEDQKIGLGLDLLSQVEEALEKIQQNPNLGTQHTILGVRRYVIQGFPYLIFSGELEEFIWVIAIASLAAGIAHGKRRPNYWKKRQIE